MAYAVSAGAAPRGVLGQIYELADSRDLPAEAAGEDGGLFYRMRPVHRLRELVAMLLACRNARDRLAVLLEQRNVDLPHALEERQADLDAARAADRDLSRALNQGT
ncbi:hypothetical protein [Streptomyces sp. NPDC006333]|uniref:hypothetical protein n=1 Tax=Streptomyces sp. NPDC006333 TaxID=3156753 RepID=UPI0033B816EA